MRGHICQAPTVKAERLQILESVLGTPHNLISWRYSDRELCEIEEEAIQVGKDLEAEGRCTACGHKLTGHVAVRNRMDRSLADLWGA